MRSCLVYQILNIIFCVVCLVVYTKDLVSVASYLEPLTSLLGKKTTSIIGKKLYHNVARVVRGTRIPY